MACLQTLAMVAFAISIAHNTLWAAFVVLLICCLPMPRSQEFALGATRMAWSLSICLACWVRQRSDDDLTEKWKQVEAEGEAAAASGSEKPLFILGNHTSFFDSVLMLAKTPWWAVKRSRTYTAIRVLQIPVVGFLGRRIGHFPIHFKKNEDGNFKVDAEKMVQVERDVDEHLRQGGSLTFFPEGVLNKNPDELLPFRYGGIQRALEWDARLVLFVCHGCPKVWPIEAAVGGFPGSVRYGILPLAGRGCQALVRELREKGLSEAQAAQPDHVLLAEHLREVMQGMYDGYRVENSSGALPVTVKPAPEPEPMGTQTPAGPETEAPRSPGQLEEGTLSL